MTNPKKSLQELLAIVFFGGVFLVILYACAPVEPPRIVTVIATESATQTPYILTAEPQIVVVTPELQIAVPTLQSTVQCPPAYLANLAVGYIPHLDLGDKKTPVTVSLPCAVLTVDFGGAYLTGQVAEDGLSLVSCTFFSDHAYPCELVIRNLEQMNVVAGYENKAGKSYVVCVAVSSKDYNAECE